MASAYTVSRLYGERSYGEPYTATRLYGEPLMCCGAYALRSLLC